MVRIIGRVLTSLENVLVVVSIVYLFGVVGLITVDVIGRRVAGASFPWIIEVAEYFLLFSTFMCSAWVLREHGHIVVDFIDKYFSPGGLRRLRIVAYALTFITVIYLLWFTGGLALDYYQRGSLQGNFILVPEWIMYAPIPFGIALFSLELTRQFRRLLQTET